MCFCGKMCVISNFFVWCVYVERRMHISKLLYHCGIHPSLGPICQPLLQHSFFKVLFTFNLFCKIKTVALSFVFDKYYLIMD